MFEDFEMQLQQRPACAIAAGQARAAGRPGGAQAISFGACRGFFHPAPGGPVAAGVVMCPPWGYEELVVRHGWRALAEELAAAGFPALRFDYPGTADAAGDLADFTLADWIAATRAAAAQLREAGAQRLIFLGQSIGCLVACAAAIGEADVAGLVLLAPVSGRRCLRELAAWSSMLGQAEGHVEGKVEGLADKGAAKGLSIAGFHLPQDLATEIKALTVTARPADFALLVEAPGRADTSFGERLAGFGVDIARLPYEGLDRLVGDPTTSQVPQCTFAQIADVLRGRFGNAPRLPASAVAALPLTGELSTRDYRETPVRFGPADTLFGILCEPRARTDEAAVLFLNTGRNAHIGWSRMTVDHARRLAAAGIASLRIDIAGVGESPARADRAKQFLYTEAPLPDVVAAIDLLNARGFGPITLVGLCSGAYLGLIAAVSDARVKSLVIANLPRLAWGRTESIEAAIRFVNRPNSQSLKRVFNADTLRLVLTGQLDPRPALAFRWQSNMRRIGLKLARFIGPLSPGWPLYREVTRRLGTLRGRGTKVFLGYSSGDEGLSELDLLFGPQGRRLAAYANVKLGIIDRADHNLSQPHARDWLLTAVLAHLAREHE